MIAILAQIRGDTIHRKSAEWRYYDNAGHGPHFLQTKVAVILLCHDQARSVEKAACGVHTYETQYSNNQQQRK